MWLTFCFTLDYILYFYAAESKFKHVTNTMHVIDFITILPGLSRILGYRNFSARQHAGSRGASSAFIHRLTSLLCLDPSR